MARKSKRNTLTYETLPALFTGICDAIRSKTGEVGTINHQDIPTAIGNIPTGGSDELIFDGAINPPSYGSTSKTLTMEKSGDLIVIIQKDNSTSSPSLTKNGTTVASTHKSVGSNETWAYYKRAVVATDVIVATTGNVGAGGANAYVTAFLTSGS